MNSPCKLSEGADQDLEKDGSGVYSLKTLSAEEVQTQREKEFSMKKDEGMEGKSDSEDNSLETPFDKECCSLQERDNHEIISPQKISEKEDQEKAREIDSGIHSPIRVNEEAHDTKECDNKETNSLQKISENEVKGAVDSEVGEEVQETKDNDNKETDSIQEISENEHPEMEGGVDSELHSPKTPYGEACGSTCTNELNSSQRLDEKKESDDDTSYDEVYSLTQLFEEDVQKYESVDNKEMKNPEKIQIPKMEDKRLMIDDERKGNLKKGDKQETYLFTQSSKEESRNKIEGIGGRLWNSPGIDRTTNQTKRGPVWKNIPHLYKKTASTNTSIPFSFSSDRKELKLPSSVETQILKQMEKLACGCCNKYCLFWNVCQVCNIFLCDFCFSISHSPISQHKITRYMAFSEFGCLAHIQISKYFCLDCIRPRCEDCKKERCREHYLITKDFKDNTGHGKVKEGNILEGKRTEASTAQSIKSASSGTKPCCKYCSIFQEQYNLCKDCMEFFCDFCLALYHPKGHAVCKGVSFSQVACAKHKVVYRYFCDQCKKMRCDECLVLEKLCSDHANSLHKLGDHLALEQVSNCIFGNSGLGVIKLRRAHY